jgi:predicted RNase H-like HicB family nuclease
MYKFLINATESGNYIQVPELTRCSTQGSTAEEVIEQCDAAIQDYLQQQTS